MLSSLLIGFLPVNEERLWTFFLNFPHSRVPQRYARTVRVISEGVTKPYLQKEFALRTQSARTTALNEFETRPLTQPHARHIGVFGNFSVRLPTGRELWSVASATGPTSCTVA